MSVGRPELSLVIPAFNERMMIGSSLKEVAGFLKKHKLASSTEVIVVAADGGDGTADIAESYAKYFKRFRVIRPGPRVGKGRDVRIGLEQATGKYHIFTDADLATPLHHIVEMLDRLRSGADIVIGVRDLDSSHEDFMRRSTSRISNLAIRLVAAPGINDTQCGFKGFRAESSQLLIQKQTVLGWGFDFEYLAIARINGLSIVTVPINDWKDPKGEQGLVGDSQLSAMTSTLKELAKVGVNITLRRYS